MAADGPKGCVFEVSSRFAKRSCRKLKLIVENIEARKSLINFHGMDLIITDSTNQCLNVITINLKMFCERLLFVQTDKSNSLVSTLEKVVSTSLLPLFLKTSDC